MTFGGTLQSMLHETGYSLVSEFVTADHRAAVRLREPGSSRVIAMYHVDAVQLARGAATLAAIVHRNRSVGDFAQQGNGRRFAGRADNGGKSDASTATNVGRSMTEAVSRGGSHL